MLRDGIGLCNGLDLSYVRKQRIKVVSCICRVQNADISGGFIMRLFWGYVAFDILTETINENTDLATEIHT